MTFYAVPMTLYIEALDETKAAGKAELEAFAATTLLRKNNSGWISDVFTKLVTNGEPMPVEAKDVPAICYKRGPIIKAFGEEAGQRMMNNTVNRAYP